MRSRKSMILASIFALLILRGCLLQPVLALGPDRPSPALATASAASPGAQPTIRASMCADLLHTTGDWRAYLEKCAANGVNTVRFFLDEVGPDWTYLPGPFKLLGFWNPYAAAGVPGQPDVPCVDLAQKNPAWWDHLREVLCAMKDLGLTPWFCFEDRCSEPYPEEGWKRWLNSFYGCAQQFPGWNRPGYYTPETGVEPKHAGGNMALGLNDYHYQYELWVIDLCYSLGITVVYGEPKNEIGYDVAQLYGIDDQIEWFRLRAEALRNLKYTLVIGSARPPILGLIVPYVDLYDVHGILDVPQLDRLAAGLDPAKTLVSTDGALDGGTGRASVFGIRSIGEDQAAVLGAELTRRGYAGWTVLPQEQIWSATSTWNVDLIDHAPTRALALATGWTPPAPPVEYVTVEICPTSGLLPNAHCPTTEDRQFVKGEEPTGTCAVHKAPEPPKPGWLAKLLEWLFGWLF